MNRSSRFFEIIQFLRGSARPVTAATLAEELAVTKRTIYRDIVALQAMRVPIEGEAGVGYMLRSGFTLPPLMFSAEELEAVIVGLSLIGRTRDADLQKAAARVLDKVTAVLPADAGPQLTSSPLMVSQWSAIPASDVCLGDLRAAIRDTRRIAIRYRDPDGEETERMLRPIGLIYYVDAVVLAAWCDLRNDFRHFRVDRIARYEVTDERFTGATKLRREWRSRESDIATDQCTHSVVMRGRVPAQC